MFGKKKKDKDAEKSEDSSLTDQLREQASDSFDKMRKELNSHLEGRSPSRRLQRRQRESVSYPWSSELDADNEVAGTAKASRTSRTKEKPNTLTGAAYEAHREGFRGHLARKVNPKSKNKKEFDPSTEEAFNTDAGRLAEMSRTIKTGKEDDGSDEVSHAKVRKRQILQAYRELGRRGRDQIRPEQNYPDSTSPEYENSTEIWALKEAYREGRQETLDEEVDVTELEDYTDQDVAELEATGQREADAAQARARGK
jgi:hypothetical protein